MSGADDEVLAALLRTHAEFRAKASAIEGRIQRASAAEAALQAAWAVEREGLVAILSRLERQPADAPPSQASERSLVAPDPGASSLAHHNAFASAGQSDFSLLLNAITAAEQLEAVSQATAASSANRVTHTARASGPRQKATPSASLVDYDGASQGVVDPPLSPIVKSNGDRLREVSPVRCTPAFVRQELDDFFPSPAPRARGKTGQTAFVDTKVQRKTKRPQEPQDDVETVLGQAVRPPDRERPATIAQTPPEYWMLDV